MRIPPSAFGSVAGAGDVQPPAPDGVPADGAGESPEMHQELECGPTGFDMVIVYIYIWLSINRLKQHKVAQFPV